MNRSTRDRLLTVALALVAALLVAGAYKAPLWKMKLRAPQYPAGLQLVAYGDRIEGDLREINIINHYIGMQKIEEKPAAEMALFPLGIGLVVFLILLAPLHRWLQLLAIAAAAGLPLVILADIQWWLRSYGQNLDPTAPLRQKPFTPLVLGTTEIGNFHSTTSLSTGLIYMFAAAALLLAAFLITRHRRDAAAAAPSASDPGVAPGSVRTAMLCLTMLAVPAGLAAQSLQQKIDAAPAGSRLEVRGGEWEGPIVIRKSLQLVGLDSPVIDGGGKGTVVHIDAERVSISGFTVRNSGRSPIEEAAGIKLRGSHHLVENNRLHDVHFGIQALHGENVVIRGNAVRPGRGRGYRGGDGINVWYLRDSEIDGNRIAAARDGIYLSFTSGITVSGNLVEHSRYGVHSMFSDEIIVVRNQFRENLLGAALMNSNRLVFSDNICERNREGATAYGILLKDIGELVVERNVIARNRVGIYADATPDRGDRTAVIRHNSIIGNDIGLALQSTARLIVTENRIADNMTTVSALGSRLSSGNLWSFQNRGNFWSDYAGIDRNRDGIGDYPHEITDTVDALTRRNPLVQAFRHTAAHRVIELAARMFPLFRPSPLLSDPAPLTRPSSLSPRYL
jgi:nitrous oxidase accessory protein